MEFIRFSPAEIISGSIVTKNHASNFDMISVSFLSFNHLINITEILIPASESFKD